MTLNVEQPALILSDSGSEPGAVENLQLNIHISSLHLYLHFISYSNMLEHFFTHVFTVD